MFLTVLVNMMLCFWQRGWMPAFKMENVVLQNTWALAQGVTNGLWCGCVILISP